MNDDENSMNFLNYAVTKGIKKQVAKTTELQVYSTYYVKFTYT